MVQKSPDRNGKEAVTLKDIALRCDVNISTVSRALRDPSRYSKATTDFILATAKELGYDPLRNQFARRLVMTRFGQRITNHLILLVLPPFFYRLSAGVAVYQGIVDILAPAGYGPLLMHPSAGDGSDAFPRSVTHGDIDAAILVNYVSALPELVLALREQSANSQLPIVVVPHLSGCSGVDIDYSSGAYAAASHLFDLGHRHLTYLAAVCNDHLDEVYAQMVASYERACADRGLNPAEASASCRPARKHPSSHSQPGERYPAVRMLCRQSRATPSAHKDTAGSPGDYRRTGE